MLSARGMPSSALCIFTGLLTLISFGAAAEDLRYTWMLPKTVIDTTVVYTFESCINGVANVKITPTLIPRTLPDLNVGQKSLSPENLTSFSEDKGISLQTFSGSRIISSIGSQPTSQAGPIASNILGGVAKLVAVFLGVAPVAGPALAVTVHPTCATGEGSAAYIASQIDDLKSQVSALQIALAKGVDDATQKKNTATIQAAQALITSLQSQLSITIKTTIDPGVSPIQVDADDDTAAYRNQKPNGSVSDTGLIASLCPSKKLLEKAKWFDNLSIAFLSGGSECDAFRSLRVNIYLDFRHSHSTMFGPAHPAGRAFGQTNVPDQAQYRDVGYIPILIWRGDKDSHEAAEYKNGVIASNVLLANPQTFAFGQFGVAQALPFDVEAFHSATWSITFSENGEITNATFSSKAWGVGATAAFGNAVSTANAIATEQRNSTNPSADALAMQGEADAIYQRQRLLLCQSSPSSCPSK